MTFPEAEASRTGRASSWFGPSRVRVSGPGEAEGPTDRERIARCQRQSASSFSGRCSVTPSTAGSRGNTSPARHQRGDGRGLPDWATPPTAGTAWRMMVADKGLGPPRFVARRSDRSRNADRIDGIFDRLRHRLIFPIFDASAGRSPSAAACCREEDEPEVSQLPRDARCSTSRRRSTACTWRKKPIIDSRTAVIVEGYTDVIACHQAGVRNVVGDAGHRADRATRAASCASYAEKVVLIFDADEAGRRPRTARSRCFLPGRWTSRSPCCPTGEDPDEPDEACGRPSGVATTGRCGRGRAELPVRPHGRATRC